MPAVCPTWTGIRDDVSLFQHARAALSKRNGPSSRSGEEPGPRGAADRLAGRGVGRRGGRLRRDALRVNDGAVQVLGDKTLRGIARELVETVRNNVTIAWTLRESVRANLRRLVKRVLRKRDYPPDKQESATRTVLEQAEFLSADWPLQEAARDRTDRPLATRRQHRRPQAPR